jgi:CheY-like chemotaxis protein
MVDDNEDDIMIARRAIKKCELDLAFHAVTDGAHLIDCLRGEGRYSDQDALVPDLILLDINMPLLDGFQTLAKVKAEPDLRTIPIVMLTTSSRDSDVIDSYARGAASYLTKPVAYDQFLSLIRELGFYWFQTVTLPGSLTP